MPRSKGFEKRFCAIAVEKGFVTVEEVVEAMRIQVMEELEKEKHRLIGEILVEKGFMARHQIEKVLKSMGIPTDFTSNPL